MQRITIIEDVCIEPNCLDGRIEDNIHRKLVSKFQGHCDQKYGHVIRISKNVKILSNTVSTTSPGVFFKVRVSMDALNPRTGDTYEGKVCLIFKEGVFVELFEKVRVLIPADNMKGFKYNKAKNCFENKGKVVDTGSALELVLDTVKYEKQNFICLGSLKTAL